MPPPSLIPLTRSQTKQAQSLQRRLLRSKPEHVDASRRLLHMCKAVDLTNEPLYSGPALQRALWRYEALWLPLLVAVSDAHARAPVLHSNAFARTVDELRRKNRAKGGVNLTMHDLVPPLDVAWIWHCHRLSPHVYERDMRALTDGGGTVEVDMETAFRFSDGEDAQSARVRMLWKNAFAFENFMPRYLQKWSWEEEDRFLRSEITTYSNEMLRAGWKSKIDTDAIARTSALQRVFLWQVVGEELDSGVASAAAATVEATSSAAGKPGARVVVTEQVAETNEWLGRAHDRYLLFLDLHNAPNRPSLLVPMNDINVAWHAHLSCSFEYNRDCAEVLGWRLDHDLVGVEERRNKRTQAILAAAAATATADSRSVEDGAGGVVGNALDAALGAGGGSRGGVGSDIHDDNDHGEASFDESLGLPSAELADMDEAEIEALLEKRRRGISIRETKTLWEATYDAHPRYDLPDTLYRGEPDGDRGGFYDLFVRANGTAHDISWVRALALMVISASVALCGAAVASWAFVRAMLAHARFLVGIPVGLVVFALGVYMFLAIPINRPLSSDARYWRDRSLKQTHNPLPPYLISSTKKVV